MRFRVANAATYPSGLMLPWQQPLASWPDELFVEVAHGLSRNMVRFVEHRGSVYALKELVEHVGLREYRLLRSLVELDLPVVEPVGLVTERDRRPTGAGIGTATSLLVTRYLPHSLPVRVVIAGGVSVDRAHHLLDALAELLVNLHLAGFFWGDVSLSNALFRRDAGRYSAYVVDAETGELRAQLSNGQRAHDHAIAEENVAG
jgi:hypothetical protein